MTVRKGIRMLDAKLFDHTLLKADATKAQIDKVCDEAVQYGFASVCVNGYYTAYVARKLKGTDVKTCTVIGFPLGQMSTRSKCAETENAIADGAQEIDMVINIGALKDRDEETVLQDIGQVRRVCGDRALLKVIIETCLLTDEEKEYACRLAKEAGADFVKTSTGFSTGGATPEDVALMRRAVGDAMGVKASGGIRDTQTAERMVDAGANRLGTSATIAILNGGNK